MKKAALPLWLATSLLSPLSLGQTTPAPTPPRPAPAPATPAKPGIVPAATTTPGTPAVELTEPTLPNIEDAMLAPPPNAAHVLGSWREALALLRSKSPSLRTSLAQVDVARARARQAMAASLPTLAVSGGNTFISHEFIRGDVPV